MEGGCVYRAPAPPTVPDPGLVARLAVLTDGASCFNRISKVWEPFDPQGWAERYVRAADADSANFPKPVPLGEVLELLENLPERAPTPPVSHPTKPMEEFLFMKRKNLAVHTVNGWTFKAGSTLKSEIEFWEKFSPDEEALEAIKAGWKGLHQVDIAPAWFKSHEQSPDAYTAWCREHLAMWQAGVVAPITKEWVRMFGPPDVLIPHFIVDEVTKKRVIADARYPNVAQGAPWFSLSSALAWASQLLPEEFWAKQDLKAGWHHILLHVSQQKLFGYIHEGQIWLYQVLAFGDSTAPYIFQKTMGGLQRYLTSIGWKRFTRYLDDVANALEK
ncbi:MAG: hypothetical protein GY721_02230, partial [Deltaproteobacteria bacterium]|nr:hypothetical protein [Deltaproteobacteria bacterium]